MVSDFDAIYQEYGKTVYCFLLSLSRDETLSEELTQETMFRAIMNISSFRGDSKISVWLCQIAKNLYLEWMKKNKRIGGAWMGGRADISNLIVTILYVIFWSVFSVRSRGYVPLIKVSFAISCITFVSAAAGLIARALHIGGFITGILSVFSSIPFYGLRFFMDWTGLYVIATALSLAWLIYTWHSKRKLEHTTDLKGD